MEPLFNQGGLQEELQEEMGKCQAIVSAVNADFLLDRTDGEVVAELLVERAVSPLQIAWDAAWSPGPSETQLDVQHDFQYGGAGEGWPLRVPGAEIVVHVPYTGDRMLVRLHPPQYSSSGYPQAELTADEICHRISGTNLRAEQVKGAFDEFRRNVMFYVEGINAQLAEHNKRLEAELWRLVIERRSRLLDQRQLAAELPFELRPVRGYASLSRPGSPSEASPHGG